MKTLLFGLLLLSFDCFSQPIKSISIDIANDADVGFSLVKSHDGYYVFSGSYCNNNTVECSGVIKLNKNLDIEWKRSLDWLDPWQAEVILKKDSSFYAFGFTNKPDSNNMYVLQLSEFGDSITRHGFNIPASTPNGISLTKNGEIALLLNRLVGVNPTKTELTIALLDSNWQIASTTQYFDQFQVINFPTLNSTPDGGFLSSCQAGLYPINDMVTGAVVKIDSTGAEVFSVARDSVYFTATSRSTHLLDGGVTFSSQRELLDFTNFPYPPVIYGTNNKGKVLWEHEFISRLDKYIFTLTTASNGDIVGVGLNANTPFYDTLDPTYIRDLGGWVFRLSPKGELLWERTIVDIRHGVSSFGYLWDLVENDHNGLVATGVIYDSVFVSGEWIENPNVWVIELDSMGCLWPNCGELQIITETNESIPRFEFQQPLLVSPNPATEKVVISHSDGTFFSKNSNLRIVNPSGKWAKSIHIDLPQKEILIDVTQMPAGTYFIQAIDRELKHISTGKMIVLNKK